MCWSLTHTESQAHNTEKAQLQRYTLGTLTRMWQPCQCLSSLQLSGLCNEVKTHQEASETCSLNQEGVARSGCFFGEGKPGEGRCYSYAHQQQPTRSKSAVASTSWSTMRYIHHAEEHEKGEGGSALGNGWKAARKTGLHIQPLTSYLLINI